MSIREHVSEIIGFSGEILKSFGSIFSEVADKLSKGEEEEFHPEGDVYANIETDGRSGDNLMHSERRGRSGEDDSEFKMGFQRSESTLVDITSIHIEGH